MRTLPKILGACAIATLACSTAWASAGSAQHHFTLWLPGGGSEVITYAGDVAPKLSFTPGDFAPASFWSPFALDAMWTPMDQILAAMDSELASMIRQADTMRTMPAFDGVVQADLRAMPPGSESYSVVSTMNGNNVCMQSVQITQEGHGRAPKVVRHSLGNCAASPDGSVLFQTLPSRHNGQLITVGGEAPVSVSSHPHI